MAFPITVLPKDDHTDFAQEERLGLPHWIMMLAICVLVDVSKYLDILTLEFLIMLMHLPFYLGLSGYFISCLSWEQPGSLDIISMTLAAVIWDARPCLCHFWYWCSSSEFWRWQRSINDAKWTFLPLFLASSITFFLFLTFVSCHAGIFSIFPILSPLPLLHLVFFLNAWSIGMTMWTRLWWVTESVPFAMTWSWWGLCPAPSGPGLVGINNACVLRLAFPNVAVGFPLLFFL